MNKFVAAIKSGIDNFYKRVIPLCRKSGTEKSSLKIDATRVAG
jgi:hypothetical protein